MSETWLPVVGYEGRYEVSDEGRVRSLPRPRVLSSRILAPALSNTYLKVNLSGGCRDDQATKNVHALVIEAFVGPCPDGMETRHLDGDSTNNRLTNLAYGTHTENVHDIVRHGRNRNASKTHCVHGHSDWVLRKSVSGNPNRACAECQRRRANGRGTRRLTASDVIVIRALRQEGALQKDIAAIYGVRQNTISRVVNGKRWAHV